MMQSTQIPSDGDKQAQISDGMLDRVFHALSDTTRRNILLKVREGEKNVNAIAADFDISLPAVSKHLSKLEQAGLISRRKQGRERLCQAEPEQFQSALDWLEFYQKFWNQKLESLKHFVEAKYQPNFAEDKHDAE